MRHKAIDKVGHLTSKIHDIETNLFAKKDHFLLIKKIEFYYNKNDGIYGFFPTYENPIYDDQINSKEESFYREFKKDWADKVKLREVMTSSEVICETFTFSSGEYIRSFTVHYDETNKKITAIKFTTNKRTLSIGKQGDLNNKIVTPISKTNYFIPGFKTAYIQDNNVCYLSYLQVYYENDNESNLEKFYKPKKQNFYSNYLKKKINTVSNICTTLYKFILILFVILFPVIFYYYKSQNLYGGEIVIPGSAHGITKQIKIHTDTNGFFHIKSETKEDSYFALGFLHAKERLWQMDFTRRAARGKLSEVFGNKGLNIDKIMRSLGLNEMSQRFANYIKLNSKYLKLFSSYINGINYYAHNFILPVEYTVLRSEWTNWELADSIAVSNLMTLTLTQDWNMEVWAKIIEENIGKEFAELVLSFRDVNFPFWNETIVNDDELMEMNMHKYKKKNIIKEDTIKSENADKDLEEEEIKEKAYNMGIKQLEQLDELETSQEILGEIQKLEQINELEKNQEILGETQKLEQINEFGTNQEILGETQKLEQIDELETNQLILGETQKFETTLEIDPQQEKSSSLTDNADKNSDNADELPLPPLHNQGASNSWVISGNLTHSGYPLLSNDPHLANSMPSLFFVAKIYLPDDTITGATMPGLPFFLIGSNKQVSWGITTENSDTADICEEKIDDDFYIYDNKKYRVATTQEVINIKNSEPEIIQLKWTRNGPVLSGALPKELLVVNFEYKHDTPLSVRFSFYNFEHMGTDFYFALNFAKASSDFINEIDKHTSPNLNLNYATKSGEIGWIPIGKFPVKNYINRFCRGYTSKDDVIDYINKEEMPKLINPSKGFIVTANNKFASFNYTYEMRGFHNNIRAYRIRELIENRIRNTRGNKFTVQDSVEIMKDVKDSLAEYMLPQILKIVERNSQKHGVTNIKYYEELKSWNFILNKNSNLPTIYSSLELYLGKQLLTNKIADHKARGIMSLLHYWNFISGIVDKIYKGERVDLKQCAHLSGNINCEKYIVYIFTNLDKFIIESDLKDKSGKVLNWGEVKFNHYPHAPFEVIPILNKLYSRSVYTGGNRNTIKIARGPFNHHKGQFVSTHSPRFKFICDMSDATRPYIIMDGGNSGNVFSKFYDNLMSKSEDTELIQYEDVDFENLSFPDARNILIRNK